MRARATSSEQLLWAHLRGSQLGVSFKRQVPLGGRFIVDFLASREKLVVEVDGAWHTGRAGADAARDRALARLGYRVLRLDAQLVVRDMAGALALVRASLAQAR
jgi:very-short-patch-repair endonuclease